MSIMELKKAVAVCLISLFSATLISVLVAHALDVQTASRLESKLDELIAEVRAFHKAGGIPAAAGDAAADDPAGDCLAVYCFHGNIRCAACLAIESQARETVQANYAPQLKSGEVVWKILNYEESAAAAHWRKSSRLSPPPWSWRKGKAGKSPNGNGSIIPSTYTMTKPPSPSALAAKSPRC